MPAIPQEASGIAIGSASDDAQMLDWSAILKAHPPETHRVATNGTGVDLLTWGAPGSPGLFLLHGAGAHAHWWDGVAPLLAQDYHIAAMTLPGNGASDWRDRYSSADIFDDVRACVAACGLADAGKPIFIGHSVGGAQLMHGAVHAPDGMQGLILVDASFRAPGSRKSLPERSRRIFATEAEALAKFRLMPPGPARQPVLVRHAAHHALGPAQMSEDGTGWCWRADPRYWAKFEPGIEQGPYPEPLSPRIPVVHIIADRSHVAAAAADLPLRANVARIMLPDCGHHIMLDRPLVLVAALRALLATWP